MNNCALCINFLRRKMKKSARDPYFIKYLMDFASVFDSILFPVLNRDKSISELKYYSSFFIMFIFFFINYNYHLVLLNIVY